MLEHDTDVDELTGPAQRAGVALERVGAEAILLDRDAGRAHVLNGSAARLWELLGHRRDRKALTAAFAASYAVSEDVVRADVEATLRGFTALGLLA